MSNMNEKFTIVAVWKLKTVEKETGKILQEIEKKNTIVNAGLSLARNLVGNLSSPSALQAIAIGTGTTGATTSDTTLETEYTREAVTPTAPSSYVLRLTKTFTFGSGVSEDITEAGLFDSSVASGSTMFNRNVFSALSVSSTIDLIATCDITFARA